MRVFLSHSSANKDFVSKVFNEIGQANAEYDEATFSAGSFNYIAIDESLKRCSIFSLFATVESLSSAYVAHEINLALEYVARGKIKKIIVFCLDGVTPRQLPPSVGVISAIRMSSSPGACARRLKSELIELDITSNQVARPYIGREAITGSIKSKLSNPEEKTPVSLAFTGFDGIGRRTLAVRVLPEIYPGIIPVPPIINLGPNTDIRDLHRSLLEVANNFEKEQVFEECVSFRNKSLEDQYSIVVNLIKSHYENKEILFLVDDGGILKEDGSLANYFKNILLKLSTNKYARPYICFILFRTPPNSVREKNKITSYFKVDLLDTEYVKQIVSLHVKAKGETTNNNDIDKIVDLTDRHPYNIQYALRILDSISVDTFVQDPSDLVAFKKRQGDEFVSKISLDETQHAIISLLRIVGQSDLDLISSIVENEVTSIAHALKGLEEYHCVEKYGKLYSINRPLKVAFERSSSFRLSDDDIRKVLSKVLDIYKSYRNEDNISISLVSNAANAALQLNTADEKLFNFVLPSNQIFVARQLYDLKKFNDCARVCETALKSPTLISADARIEAIRLRCLSLARLGEATKFNDTIKQLNSDNSPRARETKAFLEGFRLRLQGNSHDAISKFKIALGIRPNTFTTLRELSHALMVTGKLEEATKFAELAYGIAPTNPFIIDQVLALRITMKNKIDNDVFLDPSISDLLEKLEVYGDEDGRSFFAIRMADIYNRIGDFENALTHAKRATSLTPNLFSAHLVEIQILIKARKTREIIEEKMDRMRNLMDDRSGADAKTYLPQYISLKASYLIDTGKYHDAIALIKPHDRRIGNNLLLYKKRISHLIGSDPKLDPADARWLKSNA